MSSDRTWRHTRVKQVWGELQRRANEGFAEGFAAATRIMYSRGKLTDAEVKEMLAQGAREYQGRASVQSVKRLEEEAKEPGKGRGKRAA